jgi:hypothetical protein
VGVSYQQSSEEHSPVTQDVWSISPLRHACLLTQDTIPVAQNILRLGHLFCTQPALPTVQQVQELLALPAPLVSEAPTHSIEAPTRALMWEKTMRLLVQQPKYRALLSAALPAQERVVANGQPEAIELLKDVGRGAYSSRAVFVTERHDSTGEERTSCMTIVSFGKKSIEAIPFNTSSTTVTLPRRHWTIVRVCLGQPELASSGAH